MKKRLCSNCGYELSGYDSYDIDNLTLCENCFHDDYFQCSDCDDYFRINDAYYDSCGEPLCESCWDKRTDEDAPDNPSIFKKDRKNIIRISREWLGVSI